MLGYTNVLSARPGGAIEFMVSAPSDSFDLSFARLTGPAGSKDNGRRAVRGATAEGRHPGSFQPISIGSWLRIHTFPILTGFAMRVEVCPTLLDEVERGVIAWNAPGNPGLFISETGICLRLVDSDGVAYDLRCAPAIVNEWHHVRASYDGINGAALLTSSCRPRLARDDLRSEQDAWFARGIRVGGAELAIGAGWNDGRPSRHLNGKVANPVINEAPRRGNEGETVASWDFSCEQASRSIADVSGHGLDAIAINSPTRAVTGPRWTGAEVDFRLVPGQYDAIHFHEDDLESVDWRTSAALTVPKEWRSGVYVGVASAGKSTDQIPFYVRAARGQEPPVAFLAPTNTYVAYANDRNFASDLLATMKPHESQLDANDAYLAAHPELGLSLYDRHRDGVGTMYSSRLRPILTMRPGLRNWLTGTVRHFDADLILIGVLEQRNIRYSVLTDEDLDSEGVDALLPHRVVVTGSHPEYYTGAMLDALEAYVESGGRLMYLGGNGFYWVTSYGAGARHLIEVRRGYTGDRNFGSPAGEGHHSTTGEHGGIWRLRGRAPNTVAGVGFTAKGWGEGRPYERASGASDPRWAWIFDGVAENAGIGEGGLALGAAAGDEIDRYDAALGSPLHATVLASATGFSDYYQPVIEDYCVYTPDQSGTRDWNVRADMVVFETPKDGAVFSVGSISWIASLMEKGGQNAAARVTLNVLERFSRAGRVVDGVGGA